MTKFNQFILITSVLNCVSDRLVISSLLSCIISGALICSFIWAIFFLSWYACYVKGWSLRCSPGRGNAGCCAVMLYMGEGLRGSNGACSTLCRISLPLPTIKLGPSSADSRVGGLVHTLGPVGLSKGLSCEAGSFSCCHLNPHGCFQLGVLRLYFPALEAWVSGSVSLPCHSSRFIYARMWGHGDC